MKVLEKFLESFSELKNLVLKAGEVLKNFYFSHTEVYQKGDVDIVTQADLETEKFLKEGIKKLYPETGILAEESGRESQEREFFWAIDPLDGTINFAHRLPWFAISLALLHRKEPVLGIIYNPVTQEFFHAIKGKGAYLNEKRIGVSQNSELKRALLCTGFPIKYLKDRAEIFLPPFEKLLRLTQGIRRFGSAALDLAYVACGRYDAFWEPYLNPWDTAAGTVLVKEAGGKITTYTGEPYDPFKNTVLASNGLLHDELVELLKNYHPDHYKPHKNPFPTVDIIIEYQKGIVLIYRKNFPQGWAIPGGFVEYGESLEETAIREAKEETNLDIKIKYLLGCYSDPKRDPRFHTITTVFVAEGKGELKAQDDAKLARVFSLNEIPWDELVFDHAKILKDYLARVSKRTPGIP